MLTADGPPPGLSRVAERAAVGLLRNARRDLGSLSELHAGGFVSQFEQAVALFADARYAVATSTGTTGLMAALAAVGVECGDEVIVSSYGWGGTAGAVTAIGAEPVFVDIDAATCNLDVEAVREAISPRTRAVLATHLFGHPADIAGLVQLGRDFGIRLIFDAAQALGARFDGIGIGGFGDVTVLSFGRGKLLSTGEGGMTLTNDPDLYERLLLITQHPIRALSEIDNPALIARVDETSMSVRMGALPALIGKADLTAAASRLERRRETCGELRLRLASLPGWRIPWESEAVQHAFHAFALEYLPEQWDGLSRERVLAALTAEGVPVVAGPVRMPLHLRPRFKHRRSWSRDTRQRCPIAEHRCAAGEVLIESSSSWCAVPSERIQQIGNAFEKVYQSRDFVSQNRVSRVHLAEMSRRDPNSPR